MRQNTKKKRSGFGYFIRMFLLLVELLAVTLFLCENYEKEPEKARTVADFLTIASMIERQVYPVNAKFYQKSIGNFASIHTRTKPAELLNETARLEVDQLTRLTDFIRKELDV